MQLYLLSGLPNWSSLKVSLSRIKALPFCFHNSSRSWLEPGWFLIQACCLVVLDLTVNLFVGAGFNKKMIKGYTFYFVKSSAYKQNNFQVNSFLCNRNKIFGIVLVSDAKGLDNWYIHFKKKIYYFGFHIYL